MTIRIPGNLFFLFLIVGISGPAFFSQQAEVQAGEFKASCVKIDITPDSPQWLHGYAPRQSEGVHDPIFHRIVAMDDGENQFFLVSSDFCTIEPSFYDHFCQRMEKETGIPASHLWWSVTHTHAAPEIGPRGIGKLCSKTLGDRFSHEPNTEYTTQISDLLLKGIKEARSKLEPARLGTGLGKSFANVNRRGWSKEGKSVLGVDPDGPVDRQIGLIRLERLDGSPIALITNYAIHGTVMGGRNNLISGDVQGTVSEYVESKTGAPMLFINGAEGNIAPIHSVGNDFKKLEEFNVLLSHKILEANQSIEKTTDDVSLSLGKVIVDTPRKKGMGWLDEMAAYARVAEDGTNLVRIPVYTLTINRETVIWGAPLELFCEVALKVRESSPFEKTFYYGLTNGSLLYLPTKKAFSEGGYEPGVSVVTGEAEEDLTAGVIAELQKLQSGK